MFEVLKTVYFVRHGQSVDNTAPVYQSYESPLSELGRKQAAYIAERVAKLSFDSLISSPMQRAKETAETIAKVTSRVPEYSEFLVERIKPSYLYGRPLSDEVARGLWKEWNQTLYTPGKRVGDGENYDDILARANQALQFLQARPERSLVVVTHGFFLRTIVAQVLLGDLLSGEVFKRFQSSAPIENTGLTVLRYQIGGEGLARWYLWVYNDHAHLG